MSTPTITPPGWYQSNGGMHWWTGSEWNDGAAEQIGAPVDIRPPQPKWLTWLKNLSPKGKTILVLCGVGVLVIISIASNAASHSGGGSGSTASALSIVQSDGYNASSQDNTASIAPSFAGEIVTAADGLDANGNGEQCWVLTPQTDASAFEASALAESQESFPDATGSVSGNVVRVDIPAEDNPSL